MKIVDLSNILVGSDPEFFLKKDGVIFPSTDIIDGTKENPIHYGDVAIFKDNVLVEGNILPAKNKSEFIENMISLKQSISRISGFDVVSMDSHMFSAKDLASQEAKEFGCSPYNHAWKNKVLTAANLANVNHRSAGFHIHIGYEKTNKSIMKTELDSVIAKAFDYFCIYPSRLFSNDEFRNANYGAYGSYRNKPYGVEVRSLGGFFSQDKYLEWVYERTIATIEYISEIKNLRKIQMIKNPTFSTAEYRFLNINLNKNKI